MSVLRRAPRKSQHLMSLLLMVLLFLPLPGLMRLQEAQPFRPFSISLLLCYRRLALPLARLICRVYWGQPACQPTRTFSTASKHSQQVAVWDSSQDHWHLSVVRLPLFLPLGPPIILLPPLHQPLRLLRLWPQSLPLVAVAQQAQAVICLHSLWGCSAERTWPHCLPTYKLSYLPFHLPKERRQLLLCSWPLLPRQHSKQVPAMAMPDSHSNMHPMVRTPAHHRRHKVRMVVLQAGPPTLPSRADVR